MTNVLKSYHLFCIFLLYVGRLSPTSSKTDINKLCVIVFSSHYHIFQRPVKMLNCFADSIMKTYFDRYVQSTPNREPHISENTGSCCLYTRYILVFRLSQNFSSLLYTSIHTRYYPLTKCHFNRPGKTRIRSVKGILALFCYILTFGLFQFIGVSTTHRINLSIWILIYSFSDTYYV